MSRLIVRNKLQRGTAFLARALSISLILGLSSFAALSAADIVVRTQVVDPGFRFKPTQLIASGEVPPGLEWGQVNDGWQVGIFAETRPGVTGRILSVKIALLNRSSEPKFYLSDLAANPFDIILSSRSGQTIYLGGKLEDRMKTWFRRAAAEIPPDSAVVFALQFGEAELGVVTGDKVVYAKAHIPQGENQRAVEVLSENVLLEEVLNGSAGVGANARGSNRQSAVQGTTLENSGYRGLQMIADGNDGAGAAGYTVPIPPIRDNTSVPTSRTNMFAMLVLGALVAVVIGVVARALFRRPAS